MSQKYFAKSILKNGKQPTVAEHCSAVSEMAARFGLEINLEEAAELAGLLHDFGKYSQRFQDVLRHLTEKIDHAFPGAVLLLLMNSGKKMPEKYRIIAEAINAHHDGLVSYGELEQSLKNNYQSTYEFTTNAGKTSALSGVQQYSQAFQSFQKDFPAFSLKKISIPDFSDQMIPYAKNIKRMLLSRMLLSCLVDADYSVSASDENEQYETASENTSFDPLEKLDSLYHFLDEIRSGSNSDKKVNILREKVFDACGNAGRMLPGIFTLTAPTGTGKTLALLHFALRHMYEYHKKRLIIVLPFLTLTEQNSNVYRNIIPELLEAHSQSELSDEQRMFSERWRVPMIITTSVRFFETLFSDKPTDCRKLHNIANSVIVFDEAQSLPSDLTGATMTAVKSLCDNYGCSMVFSTATQPLYSAYPLLKDQWSSREILPDYSEFFRLLRRTDVEWRLDRTIPLDAIAAEAADKQSVCVIVNLRAHASAVFAEIKKRCDCDSVFYLTTDLCPAHRSSIIKRIRKRLSMRLPCRVVATQCIEAGVDLDFDNIYRALAPLDSVIQAAGRCNRNGRMRGMGNVVVFEPESENGKRIYPDVWYQNAAETVKRLCMDRTIDINDPEDIDRYYRSIFHEAADRRELRRAVECMDYQATREQYCLIGNSGMRVIVPYSGCIGKYREIQKEMIPNGLTPALIKRAADITVTVYFNDKLEEIAENIPYSKMMRKKDESSVHSQFYILRSQWEQLYLSDMGLQIKEDL